MATIELAGATIEVDAEGFMLDSARWTPQIAREIARGEGIDELTERHFAVIEFMRAEFAKTGSGPSIRALKNRGGIPTKELYELFPSGPAKKAAKIAGIPKPHGCI